MGKVGLTLLPMLLFQYPGMCKEILMNQGDFCLPVFLRSEKPVKIQCFLGISDYIYFLCASINWFIFKYCQERETPLPRFAQHGTFEYEYSQRWEVLMK